MAAAYRCCGDDTTSAAPLAEGHHASRHGGKVTVVPQATAMIAESSARKCPSFMAAKKSCGDEAARGVTTGMVAAAGTAAAW